MDMKMRLTRYFAAIFVCFTISVLAADTNSQPREFKADVIGINASTCRVALTNGILFYTRDDPAGITLKMRITPTDQQWREFREALDKLKVWEWRSNYVDLAVVDGTAWNIDIEYSDRKLHVHGANSYPDNAGKPSGKPAQTKTFKDYLTAVQKLLGGKRFE
jgi:hypothetical protein